MMGIARNQEATKLSISWKLTPVPHDINVGSQFAPPGALYGFLMGF